VAALVEMYVQGVSTRKVKAQGRAVTEALCGHSFSASAISRINKRLDAELARFATRKLDDAVPYLILDARGARPAVACGRPEGEGPRGRRHQEPAAPAGGGSISAGRC
jgi:hypothetical protein